MFYEQMAHRLVTHLLFLVSFFCFLILFFYIPPLTLSGLGVRTGTDVQSADMLDIDEPRTLRFYDL